MHINRRFEYPAVDRVTLESGSRYYICPETNGKLASVTTILSATSDKDFSAWEARIGKVKADQERKYGTDLGSLVHDHMEKHMLNEDRPGGTNIIRMEAKRMSDTIIERAIPHMGEVWGIETPLFYPGLYAGTTDVVGEYQGIASIMDFKTAKKLRKREDIKDYAAQLGAYAIAHDERYGTHIKQGVIFMVARDCSYECFIYNQAELQAGRDDFLNRVSSYYSTFTGFA